MSEQKQITQEDIQNMSPEEVQKLVREQCLFCKISDKKIPAKIVYEDDNNIGFLDIRPANPGHVLVVPKNHHSVLPQMPESEVESLFKAVRKVASAVFESLNAEGINIIQNNGQVAGQVVPHVHVHVIPRFNNDGINFTWKEKQVTEDQLAELQKRISGKLSGLPSSNIPGLEQSQSEQSKTTQMNDLKEKFPKLKPFIP